MVALSYVLLVLFVLWFLVGLVPLPFVDGFREHFPKRHPALFVLVAVVLLGGAIALHLLGG